MPAQRSATIPLFLLITALAVLAWSGIRPNGQFNWLMETLPAMIGAVVMLITYKRFPLTTVSYCLIWFFSLILMIGGHYTYAEVPIGFWFSKLFDLQRNHFDRFGHFFQGVIPAMVAREMLIRQLKLPRGIWLFGICVSIALAISASYELFEWAYAVTCGGEAADDFLGSQGDIWDAQKDMLMALLGAITSQLVLGQLQNKQIDRLP